MLQKLIYVLFLVICFTHLQGRADFFSDNALMHFSQDLYLTKSNNSTYHNFIFLPDKQYCEIKYSHAGLKIEKEKLLLAYSHDNMTVRELKYYKPRVITDSYLVKTQAYIRKPELITELGTWSDSQDAKYCRQLELSVFNQNKPSNSRMPASTTFTSPTATAVAITSSIKNTFYNSCVKQYNTLNFNFTTQTKFNVNVSCQLLTDNKKQVISLLEPYFLILDK